MIVTASFILQQIPVVANEHTPVLTLKVLLGIKPILRSVAMLYSLRGNHGSQSSGVSRGMLIVTFGLAEELRWGSQEPPLFSMVVADS